MNTLSPLLKQDGSKSSLLSLVFQLIALLIVVGTFYLAAPYLLILFWLSILFFPVGGPLLFGIGLGIYFSGIFQFARKVS